MKVFLYAQVILSLSSCRRSAAFFINKANSRSFLTASFSTRGPPGVPSEGPVNTPVTTDEMRIMSPSEEAESYLTSRALFPGATRGRSPLDGGGIENFKPMPMFPVEMTLERIEGAGTVRTFKIPPWAERAQYVLTTNGRPLAATVELWVGPIRKTHTLECNVENGQLTPVRATLKFKKEIGPSITIRTSEAGELPCSASVMVPSPERSDELMGITEKVWKSNPKTKIQGGIIQPDGKSKGAVRYFNVPQDAEGVQILAWSKDTGKKSLKCKIEVLQGPNNPKQSFFLQCGGGSQPYHAVFETPGGGGVIRVVNEKFLEDGLFEMAVVPFRFSRDEGDESF